MREISHYEPIFRDVVGPIDNFAVRHEAHGEADIKCRRDLKQRLHFNVFIVRIFKNRNTGLTRSDMLRQF